MKKLLVLIMMIIGGQTFASENLRVIGGLENKKSGEEIRLECKASFCDEIFISRYQTDGSNREVLTTIPLYWRPYFSDLQGGQMVKGWTYKVSESVFEAGSGVISAGFELPGDILEKGDNGSGDPSMFFPLAAVVVTAGAVVDVVGAGIWVGETLYYFGRDIGRAIIDSVNPESIALRRYRKVISGKRIKVSDSAYRRVESLLVRN